MLCRHYLFCFGYYFLAQEDIHVKNTQYTEALGKNPHIVPYSQQDGCPLNPTAYFCAWEPTPNGSTNKKNMTKIKLEYNFILYETYLSNMSPSLSSLLHLTCVYKKDFFLRFIIITKTNRLV